MTSLWQLHHQKCVLLLTLLILEHDTDFELQKEPSDPLRMWWFKGLIHICLDFKGLWIRPWKFKEKKIKPLSIFLALLECHFVAGNLRQLASCDQPDLHRPSSLLWAWYKNVNTSIVHNCSDRQINAKLKYYNNKKIISTYFLLHFRIIHAIMCRIGYYGILYPKYRYQCQINIYYNNYINIEWL